MRLRTRVDPHRFRVRLLAWIGLVTTFQVLLAPAAAQANGASDWMCKNLPFADHVCHVVDSTNKAIDFASDPLGYIAQFFTNAVTSLLTMMFKALESTTTVDWTNPGFIRTYTMAFAASSVLTMVFWLIAVAKRVVQGINPAQALGESVGYLLLSVVVTAFAPAGIYYVVQLFDEASDAMLQPVFGDIAKMTVPITAAMAVLFQIPGGSVLLIGMAMGLLGAIAGVWLELIVRSALIMAGLVFGPTVFSGLVDKALWDHTKRWIGVMVAVIASKYVTFTIIALASGLLVNVTNSPSVSQAFATLFTALALFVLALFLPFQITKFLPILGDELAGIHQARDDLKGRGKQAAGSVGDTFSELKSRLSSGGTGGASPAEGQDEGDADAEGADMPGQGLPGSGPTQGADEGSGDSGPGVGAPTPEAAVAEKAQDEGEQKVQDVANQGTNAATAGMDNSGGSGPPASTGPETSAPPPTAPSSSGGSSEGSAPPPPANSDAVWPPPEES